MITSTDIKPEEEHEGNQKQNPSAKAKADPSPPFPRQPFGPLTAGKPRDWVRDDNQGWAGDAKPECFQKGNESVIEMNTRREGLGARDQGLGIRIRGKAESRR